ncbi:TetR/AcrR family transcriptional regulator [Vitiosangium sp. GDMCC 1.1324]|uniref:TetR/AcrR family transcriptional regulator n=1 Tax=Vitiosangium sp. (strain GDMCC 1.1324) TaxID=2138576 RepID=UPI000D38CE34|nr:TetR/AcrR family transcriptional regulator [Vitiosangium sp. GDMCC 1.1324]PTL77716.1 BetI family transcriptional regulator [Vitiosangium sp. GDMCC 1.1324]
MSEEEGLRERKKRETRQTISNVATRLFTERGFDQVTVADVAEAANVSKMTVFNYFPRKEDLFFDRQDEGLELLREALQSRRRGQSPLAALRALAQGLVERQHPFAKIDEGVALFWRTVQESAALRARARELREQLEEDLAAMLAESAGASREDSTAKLVATMVVAAWSIAYREGLRRLEAGEAPAAARSAFVTQLERGFAMVFAGAKGTPYA